MTQNDYIENLKAKDKIRILFVCLGNICRSPAAHGIFEHLMLEKGLQNRFEVDSAGIYGGHAGDLPDRRMRQHAFVRGYRLEHRSRPVRASDFDNFNLIIAMDDSNYDALRRLAPTVDDQQKVVRMVEWIRSHPRYDSVPDPYYEGAEGFELVLDMLEDGCANLIDTLTHTNKPL